jgi:hypothetical protein
MFTNVLYNVLYKDTSPMKLKDQTNTHRLVNKALFVLIIVLLLIGAGLGYTTFYPLLPKMRTTSQDKNKTTSLGPTATPTPTYLRPGKETYTVSQSSDMKGPKITSVSFDPHDPVVGSAQTITLTAYSKTPIKKMSIEFVSDNKTRILQASRVGGSATDELWQAMWTTDDTVSYKYVLTILSEDANDASKLIIAPRS